MRNFRLLKADEIECRISTITEKGLTLLLYKTARTDYQLLDETVGMYNWQNDYKVIDGKMYCGIGIRCAGGLKIDPNAIYNNPPEWVWKWNVGTESNTEAEKGQASDAMKRAGFAWGIGTELYSAPYTYIPAEACRIEQNNKGKYVCYDRFFVRQIEYNDAEDISKLVIVNGKGNTVFEYPRQKSAQVAPQQQPAPAPKAAYPATPAAATAANDGSFQPTCANCGKPISIKVHDYSVKKFGAPMCMDCQKTV